MVSNCITTHPAHTQTLSLVKLARSPLLLHNPSAVPLLGAEDHLPNKGVSALQPYRLASLNHEPHHNLWRAVRTTAAITAHHTTVLLQNQRPLWWRLWSQFSDCQCQWIQLYVSGRRKADAGTAAALTQITAGSSLCSRPDRLQRLQRHYYRGKKTWKAFSWVSLWNNLRILWCWNKYRCQTPSDQKQPTLVYVWSQLWTELLNLEWCSTWLSIYTILPFTINTAILTKNTHKLKIHHSQRFKFTAVCWLEFHFKFYNMPCSKAGIAFRGSFECGMIPS